MISNVFTFDSHLSVSTRWTEFDKLEVELLHDVYFEWKGNVYHVEKGFLSDGGSIPRLCWRIITPFDPRAIAAFIVHDKICKDGKDMGLSRKQGDEILRAILKCNHFNYQADGIYRAVRAYAKLTFKD